jgi:hypothetical protein
MIVQATVCQVAENADREQGARKRKQQPRERIGRGDHRTSAKGVEQTSEKEGAKKVSGGKGEEIPAHPAGLDVVEVGENERVGEEDGVVEEGLRRHQAEADECALSIGAK